MQNNEEITRKKRREGRLEHTGMSDCFSVSWQERAKTLNLQTILRNVLSMGQSVDDIPAFTLRESGQLNGTRPEA